MPTFDIDALMGELSFNAGLGSSNPAVDYPIYTCYIPADIIDQIAHVPRFSASDDHQSVSSNLQGVPSGATPTEKWQRPMITSKLTSISQTADELPPDERVFPNPVLLGVNYQEIRRSRGASIQANQVATTLQQGIVQLYHIEIGYDDTQPRDRVNGKPLLIIDGQHRIIGLAQSSQQSQQLIPCVILHDPNLYPMDVLARIFSEVSTKATKLDDMHQNWMEYAFSMSQFKAPRRNYQQWNDSMQTTVLINSEADFNDDNTSSSAPSSNIMRDSVQFNPMNDTYGCFHVKFEADTLCKLIRANYFSASPNVPMSSEQLYQCIARAFCTLHDLDINRSSATSGSGSQLFDNTTDSHSVQLGWGVMKGILQFLANWQPPSGGPSSPYDLTKSQWTAMWRASNFQSFDWRLSHADLTGRPFGTGEPSKKPGRRTVANMIEEGLKGNLTATNAARNFLRGSRSFIEAEATGGANPALSIAIGATSLRKNCGTSGPLTVNMQAGRASAATTLRDTIKLKFSSNCGLNMYDNSTRGRPATKEQIDILKGAFNNNGVNLDTKGLPRGTYDFVVVSQSYGLGTQKRTDIRVIY